jgi:hypothetical protein
MICGAQKAGTTSLLHYLKSHSDIAKQKVNEFAYFVLDDMYKEGYDTAFEKYFEPSVSEKSVVVAKNVGVMYMPKAIERLYKHNPKTQIVLLLRNPVERAYSNYFYALRKGDETITTFEKAIETEPERLKEDADAWRNCAYLERGLYVKSIEEFLKYFLKSQLHIYLFEDFKRDPSKICNEIFLLLGLETNLNIDFKKKHNEKAMAKSTLLAKTTNSKNLLKKLLKSFIGSDLRRIIKKKFQKINETSFEQPKMKEETRKKLIEYFKPWNQKLEILTGLNISDWNI